MTDTTYYLQILHAMQMNAQKKEDMPQDLLGRSLAYNCYLPRLSEKSFLYDSLKRQDSSKLALAPHKALYGDYTTWTNMLQTSTLTRSTAQDDTISCVIFDDCATYGCMSDLNACLLDYLSVARRMLPSFVIHKSVFIDGYQLLESAIGGADMIVLDIAHIRTFLTCLSFLQNNPNALETHIDQLAIHIAQYVLHKKDSQSHQNNMQDMDYAKENASKATNHPTNTMHARKSTTPQENNPASTMNHSQDFQALQIQPNNMNHNRNTNHNQDSNALQIQLNQLITYAYNLGLVPIVRIYSSSDIALLHSLVYFPHCVYAPQECMSALPNDCILFCEEQTQEADVCVIKT